MIDLALRDRATRTRCKASCSGPKPIRWIFSPNRIGKLPASFWKQAASHSMASRLIACVVWWKASARSQGKRWETADVHIRWLYYCYQVELTVLPALLARAEFTLRHKIAAMFGLREWVDAGGLLSYGVSFLLLYRRAAEFVDMIAKGAKPADLPVEQPTKFELILNLRTAMAIGLTISPRAGL